MKKLYFGLLMAALVALASCAKDAVDGGGVAPGVEDNGNSVYFDVALSLPTADSTRSTTDNDKEGEDGNMGGGQTPSDGKDQDGNPEDAEDYEYGYDYENQVNSLILVIADAQDNYVMHSTVNALPVTQKPSDTDNYKVTATAKFSLESLEKEYADGGKFETSKLIHLYAFCNFTEDLLDYFDTLSEAEKTGVYADASSTTAPTSWLNKALELTEVNGAVTGSVWGRNAFQMTNAIIVEAELPADIKDWSEFTKESEPFHLSTANTKGTNPVNNGQKRTDEDAIYRGAIKVERSAARLDFKDGSGNNTPANTYKLTGSYFTATETSGNVSVSDEAEDVNLFNIQLTEMSLVNMSKEYFALRRVSDDGTPKGWRIGKYEMWTSTKWNYVVDTDWDSKDADVVVSTINGKFNYPLFQENTVTGKTNNGKDVYKYNSANWYTSKISTVLANNAPSDTWNDKSYKIWRYVTENTIPGNGGELEPDKYQRVGYSTGIVFRGQITLGDDKDALYAEQTVDEETGETKVKAVPFISAAVKTALGSTSATSPALYWFNNLFYAGFADDFLKTAYAEGDGSPLYIVANKILKNMKLGTTEDATNFKFDGTGTALTLDIYWALKWAVDGDFEGEDDNEKTENNPLYTYFKNKANYTFEGENNIVESGDAAVKLKNAITENNITIYEPEQIGGEWGYYCYYFYWNRHNDNGNNAKMGPMEFATVRNNVYKLSVTSIGRIGHPTIPENDPDPIIPDDPDEDQDVYMDVQVEILPWVVRVNNIEF